MSAVPVHVRSIACNGHTGMRLQALFDFRTCLTKAIIGSSFGVRQVKCNDVLGVEPEIAALQIVQGVDKQPGTDQQRQGERKLTCKDKSSASRRPNHPLSASQARLKRV